MSPACRACGRPWFRPVDGVEVCADCGHPYEPTPLPHAAQARPVFCPGGHELAPVLFGWAPCTCRGHEILYCRCGAEVHVLPERPKAPCSTATQTE